jgi:hypothetical protein
VSARLLSGFYRQPEALASDLATIAANAEAFNGEGSELAEDGAALAAYLTTVLQGRVREGWSSGGGVGQRRAAVVAAAQC